MKTTLPVRHRGTSSIQVTMSALQGSGGQLTGAPICTAVVLNLDSLGEPQGAQDCPIVLGAHG